MKNKTVLIGQILMVCVLTGCSLLGVETQTPGDRSWSLISAYPTQTPVTCKTGIQWAQNANQLGTKIGIKESIWFKESDFEDWEYSWLRENEMGYFFLSYNENEDGCIVEALGGVVVQDYDNDAAGELGAFVITIVQDYFDETFDYDSNESVGETDRFISETLDNCHREEYKKNYVDQAGNTWLMTCAHVMISSKEGSLFSILYQSK